MYILAGMAYSDVIAFNTLCSLIEKFGINAVITQKMISQESGLPLSTTQYALRRLMSSNKIVGQFRAGVGYTYKVIDGCN